jgi:DNA-binding PadR family transcriptional regulator
MIKYALLGLLREQADYGYSLKLRFEQQLGSVWRLNTGQVYQTLRRLTRAGLVVEIEVEGAGGAADPHRPRKTFQLTAKGARFSMTLATTSRSSSPCAMATISSMATAGSSRRARAR